MNFGGARGNTAKLTVSSLLGLRVVPRPEVDMHALSANPLQGSPHGGINVRGEGGFSILNMLGGDRHRARGDGPWARLGPWPGCDDDFLTEAAYEVNLVVALVLG